MALKISQATIDEVRAVAREQAKTNPLQFVTYFQSVQSTFGPGARDDDGIGYDRRFRSIGVGAVTEDGTVWPYSYDYKTCMNGGDAITRWVRADGKIVEPIPGQPS